MKRDQPTTPEEWLDEIRLAIEDARETGPFAEMIGETIVVKDAIMMGAALVTMADSAKAYLRTRSAKNHLHSATSPQRNKDVAVAV